MCTFSRLGRINLAEQSPSKNIASVLVQKMNVDLLTDFLIAEAFGYVSEFPFRIWFQTKVHADILESCEVGSRSVAVGDAIRSRRQILFVPRHKPNPA